MPINQQPQRNQQRNHLNRIIIISLKLHLKLVMLLRRAILTLLKKELRRYLKRELMRRLRNQRIIIKNNNLNMKIKKKLLLPLLRKHPLQKKVRLLVNQKGKPQKSD
jgi:hypothetical protein